ncbi:hypothetical protein [Thioalkalivibrio sp. XN279]|uniref:hypothetical protein n=1 Tax=Thioalkalivibrio sp. XN279 TaxID=2714953 RepID=UPI00140D4E3D|nr:hypothetical protein [Thioalkalivibrio sp. XN279]NHA15510.1 hypothetical protein [Thioalkalivibrio sp. XN279]
MKRDFLLLAGVLLALGHAPGAMADERPAAAEAPAAPPPLDVTMRVIDNPDAVAPEAITRRIALPPVPPRTETQERGSERERAQAPTGEAERNEIAQEARERQHEVGQDAADRAREMAEQAAEQREEFGRSRAEEIRPERPEPPEPPRPPRP